MSFQTGSATPSRRRVSTLEYSVTDLHLQQLEAAGAKVGILMVSLMWARGIVFDQLLDLHCTTPDGNHIFHNDKRQDGGELDVGMLKDPLFESRILTSVRQPPQGTSSGSTTSRRPSTPHLPLQEKPVSSSPPPSHAGA